MTVLHRWLARSALLAGCLGLLLPAIAIAAKDIVAFPVDDKAKMFGKEAIEKANQKILAIKRDYDEDVLIETHDALPEEAQKEYKGLSTKEEKDRFWGKLAKKRYENRNVHGIYLLIVKNPARYQFVVGETTEKRAFTPADRKKAEKLLEENLEAKTFDKGLLAVVNDIDLTLNANGGKKKSSSAVLASTKSTATGMFSSIWGMICIGLVIVLALWVVVGVFRALTGAGNRPVDRAPYGGQGGYGPQGGGGGGYAPQQQSGGGGGFMKGMLGGMLGAAGGMFLYDRFFGGGHSPMGGGMTPTAYGGTAPADNDDRAGDTGGGDWGSSGAREEAGGGGGGDWGNKGDDSGGGSFGGGDDGGGASFGGGGDDGGGGDWGGGGDGGGDGGGGGDW